jgi:hypothetical protein
VSWNEVWTGTAQVRNLRFEGKRLVMTTNPTVRRGRQAQLQRFRMGAAELVLPPNHPMQPTAARRLIGTFNVCLLDFLRPLSAVLTFRFGSKADTRT